MSGHQHTEVTSQSWFSRIASAFGGALVGLILFVVAFPLLFWNEGRSVERYKTLKEGAGAVVTIPSDRVERANSGSLVHVIGKADTEETLTDDLFDVSANAIKLERVAEMYQWEEASESSTEKEVGGGSTTTTTYSYSKKWSDKPISSSSFRTSGYQNPTSMPYRSSRQVASDVALGAFTLSSSLIHKISNFTRLPLGSDYVLPESVEGSARLYNEGIYIGNNPATPQIGDMRIKFYAVLPSEVSVIAEQMGGTFVPHATQAGGRIELLETGVHSADAMFQKAQRDNKILTIMMRFAGFFLMFFGLFMILRPLSVFADVLPAFGNIVGAGIGIISFLLAAVFSLSTMTIAWIFYRPLLGIIMATLTVSLIIVIIRKLKSAKSIRQQNCSDHAPAA